MAYVVQTDGRVTFELKCDDRCGEVLGSVTFTPEQLATRKALGLPDVDPDHPLDGHLCDGCARQRGLKQ